MASQRTPFDSIEGALEYIGLLREAAQKASNSVQEDIVRARAENAARRIHALQLVTYKLERLCRHLDASHRLLNDLRTLRRLILNERPGNEA